MNYFNLREHGATLKNEILSGLTVFFTMVYILQVNPAILSEAGMNPDAVFISTALAAAVTTFIAGIFAKLPLALAPGLGINSFFVVYVVKGLHFSWQTGLLAVYISGLLFIVVVRLNLYDRLLDAIPACIKSGIIAGLGIATVLLSFRNAGILSFHASGDITIGVSELSHFILFVIGLGATLFLMHKNKAGSIFYGMVVSCAAGIIWHVVTGSQQLDFSLSGLIALPRIAESGYLTTFFQFPGFSEIFASGGRFVLFCGVVALMFFTHFFNASGTLFGLLGQLEESGRAIDESERKKALYVEGAGAVVSSLTGTSAVTTFAECSSGIAAKARTGITAVVVACCFLLSLLFSPLFALVHSYSVAPALLISGVALLKSVRDINFRDITDVIPSLIVFICIGLTFQIFNSILFGVTAYIIAKLVTGKWREINKYSYVIAAVGILLFAYNGFLT